ncbi:MAG: gliding motility-associated C-terminal domain-containing protein [Bacteroidales bacterium]|nr:gliding motility-associated C-terminal domain-containing protein [Bacteroidales bacterium]
MYTQLRSPFRFLIILFTFLFSPSLFATHQRAAEIVYKHISGLTYEITLISYTFTPSPANAYRDYLPIIWGDGTASDIPRTVITDLPNDITYNKYVGQHTFPGPATYTISCEDPNRNGGILNIPNSINTPLFIYSELTISPFIGGYNNSPVLLLPPIDNGCVNQPFYHNPGAYDVDGDSLSYKLVPCRGAQGLIIPGYFSPPASKSLTLNPITGDLYWDSPEQQGEYNIAILIEEWRNGVKIGSVLRDMQIIIVACNNHPPVIDSVADTCIEAGKTLRFPVSVFDPDSNNVTLTGTGGPLVLPVNPATLNPNPAIGKTTTRSLFQWNTVCDHIKKQPYYVFFKAKDDGTPVNLVAIKSINILVVGPPPENLTATPMGNTVTLQWDPYSCINAKGFRIFRKADSTGYIPGYCQTGVPPYLGYSKIATLTGLNQTSFLDDNQGAGLVRGVKYCYLVIAWYKDDAESYASNEACAILNKDVAVITNVSINTTQETTGSVYVAWSKPTEIDTLQAPGPYKYLIARSRFDNPGTFSVIDSLDQLNDTICTDQLLNTLKYGFKYRIDLFNVTPGNRFLIGSSQIASSMFLSISPTDKMLKLSWTNEVPWNNKQFTIYRKDPGSIAFDSVGTSTAPVFNDPGLVNGETYCYRIKSTGMYSASGFVDPIINYSQENCGIPVDNLPPCPPRLKVETRCIESTNTLTWGLPADTCSKDIAKYYIYYSRTSGDMLIIDSLLNPSDTTYIHSPAHSIVGCYGVIAVDSAGNRSAMSNIVCIDNTACPVYTLPNVFTPNGDTKNDYFTPKKPYTSVEEINLKIFDRWGRVVFETHEPDINWDGKDKNTNQPCSDGTYFFVCDVFEITLQGTLKRSLQGSLTILR